MIRPYSKLEEDERKAIFQNRLTYQPTVKIGFWIDDLAKLEEDKFITAHKKENCQLLIQKMRKMFRNLLKPSELALDLPYVLYGQNYQIQAADCKKQLTSDPLNMGLYLTGLVTELEIDYVQHFTHGCVLSVSNTKHPCTRNTFKITGTGNNQDGQQVLYGTDVFLEISDNGGNGPLYVSCENSTINSIGEHLQLKLSKNRDIYCRFKFLYWDPAQRFATNGTTYSPNAPVIIQHTASGKNLVVDPTHLFPTFFGPECFVTCDTCRDSHKMETAENFWKIVCTPKTNLNLFLKAAKGENIPEELLVD